MSFSRLKVFKVLVVEIGASFDHGDGSKKPLAAGLIADSLRLGTGIGDGRASGVFDGEAQLKALRRAMRLHGCPEVIGNNRGALKDLGAAFLHDDGLHAENITARLDDEGQLTHLCVSRGQVMAVD
jgi:hypothetical protein